jgi:hypothetical protein
MDKHDVETLFAATFPGEDGRYRFDPPRTLGDRLLEWTLPALWTLVAVVVVVALWWTGL